MLQQQFYLIDCLIVIFVLWVFFFTYVTYYWFGKKFDYLDNQKVKTNPQYQGFIRNDRQNWNPFEFFLVGVLLLPIRLFFIFIIVIIPYIILKPLSFLISIENQFFKFISNLLLKIAARLILYQFGFFWINKKLLNFNQQKYPNLISDGKIGEEKIIISNHQNFFDIFIHLYLGRRSFVAKKEIGDLYIIGFYAKITQTIFVSRFDKESRKKTFQKIKERLNDENYHKKYNNFIFFPEGTTSNGDSILKLKKGAFVHNIPIRIQFFQYFGTIKPTRSLMTYKEHFLCCLCNFYNSVYVYNCNDLLNLNPEQKFEKENWEVFSEEIRKFICNELNLKIVDSQLEDALSLEKELGIQLRKTQDDSVEQNNIKNLFKIFLFQYLFFQFIKIYIQMTTNIFYTI